MPNKFYSLVPQRCHWWQQNNKQSKIKWSSQWTGWDTSPAAQSMPKNWNIMCFTWFDCLICWKKISQREGSPPLLAMLQRILQLGSTALPLVATKKQSKRTERGQTTSPVPCQKCLKCCVWHGLWFDGFMPCHVENYKVALPQGYITLCYHVTPGHIQPSPNHPFPIPFLLFPCPTAPIWKFCRNWFWAI